MATKFQRSQALNERRTLLPQVSGFTASELTVLGSDIDDLFTNEQLHSIATERLSVFSVEELSTMLPSEIVAQLEVRLPAAARRKILAAHADPRFTDSRDPQSPDIPSGFTASEIAVLSDTDRTMFSDSLLHAVAADRLSMFSVEELSTMLPSEIFEQLKVRSPMARRKILSAQTDPNGLPFSLTPARPEAHAFLSVNRGSRELEDNVVRPAGDHYEHHVNGTLRAEIEGNQIDAYLRVVNPSGNYPANFR